MIKSTLSLSLCCLSLAFASAEDLSIDIGGTLTSPYIVSSFSINSRPSYVAFYGTTGFISGYSPGEISYFDASQPGLGLKGTISANNPFYLTVSGTTGLYIDYVSPSNVCLFDASNPPYLLTGSISVPGNPVELAVYGTTCYVTHSLDAPFYFDITRPQDGIKGFILTPMGTELEAITISGTTCFVGNVAATSIGYFDASNPPLGLETFISLPLNARTFSSSYGTTVYTSLQSDDGQTGYIGYLDASRPQRGLLGTFSLTTGTANAPYGLAVSGTTGYAAYKWQNRVNTFDASRPSRGQTVSVIDSIEISQEPVLCSVYPAGTIGYVSTEIFSGDAPYLSYFFLPKLTESNTLSPGIYSINDPLNYKDGQAPSSTSAVVYSGNDSAGDVTLTALGGVAVASLGFTNGDFTWAPAATELARGISAANADVTLATVVTATGESFDVSGQSGTERLEFRYDVSPASGLSNQTWSFSDAQVQAQALFGASDSQDPPDTVVQEMNLTGVDFRAGAAARVVANDFQAVASSVDLASGSRMVAYGKANFDADSSLTVGLVANAQARDGLSYASAAMRVDGELEVSGEASLQGTKITGKGSVKLGLAGLAAVQAAGVEAKDSSWQIGGNSGADLKLRQAAIGAALMANSQSSVSGVGSVVSFDQRSGTMGIRHAFLGLDDAIADDDIGTILIEGAYQAGPAAVVNIDAKGELVSGVVVGGFSTVANGAQLNTYIDSYPTRSFKRSVFRASGGMQGGFDTSIFGDTSNYASVVREGNTYFLYMTLPFTGFYTDFPANAGVNAKVSDRIYNNCPQDTQNLLFQMQYLDKAQQGRGFGSIASSFKIVQYSLEKLDLLLHKELEAPLYAQDGKNRPFLILGYDNLNQDPQGGYNGYDVDSYYQMLGTTHKWHQTNFLAALTVSESYMKVRPASAKANYTAVWGALGASQNYTRWQFGLDALFGYSFIDAKRRITVGDFFDDHAKTNHGAWNLSFDAKTCYKFHVKTGSVKLYENLGYNYGHENDYSESGAPGANQKIKDERLSQIRNQLGMAYESTSKAKIQVFVDGSWVYEYDFADHHFKAAYVGTDVWGTYSQTEPPRSFGRLYTGFKGSKGRFDWRVAYTGLFGRSFKENSASIQLGYKF